MDTGRTQKKPANQKSSIHNSSAIDSKEKYDPLIHHGQSTGPNTQEE